MLHVLCLCFIIQAGGLYMEWRDVILVLGGIVSFYLICDRFDLFNRFLTLCKFLYKLLIDGEKSIWDKALGWFTFILLLMVIIGIIFIAVLLIYDIISSLP